VVPTRSLQNSVMGLHVCGSPGRGGDKYAVPNCEAISAIGSRVRIPLVAVFLHLHIHCIFLFQLKSRLPKPSLSWGCWRRLGASCSRSSTPSSARRPARRSSESSPWSRASWQVIALSPLAVSL
jgi:hypothetical protein